MNDMQFAKYSCDIREILGNMTEKDQFANLVRNAVAYAISNSSSQTNWIARELFIDWSYVKKKYKLNTTNFLFLCNC